VEPPSSLFPQGLSPTGGWNPVSGPPYQRLFQNTGFSYEWLYGNEGNQLQMHNVDVSTSLVLQPFGRSDFGFRLTPGFTFRFLDGPQPPPEPNRTHLPAQLYDAYLDVQWDPRITQQFRAELNFRTGVYSDLQTVTTDSIRFMGTGLGVIQMTPATALKLGVTYLDRLDIKILPALGVLWEPNPQTKFDIFFPRPKIAKYWTTLGNANVWWYLGGEYGTGNWTIERVGDTDPGYTDRIDINDIRVFGGLQWYGVSNRTGFFDVGYVFDREILFDRVPDDDLKLDDTFMLRAGIRF
jgi:hypothetical protein